MTEIDAIGGDVLDVALRIYRDLGTRFHGAFRIDLRGKGRGAMLKGAAGFQ